MFTLSSYYSSTHQLRLENAFCVVKHQCFQFNRRSADTTQIPMIGMHNTMPVSTTAAATFVPSKTITTVLSVFTNEEAYLTDAQPLHDRNINVVVDIDATEAEVIAAIQNELNK